MATQNAPRAEFVDIFGKPLLKGEPEPQNGFIELSEDIGFGYTLDEDVLSGKTSNPLIW
jgi:L-alanine-DL-glutamate epimerase-like enolase superfamily enzyme